MFFAVVFIIIAIAAIFIVPKAIKVGRVAKEGAKEGAKRAKEIQDAWEQAKSELGKDDAEMAKSIFKKLAE